MIKMQSQFFKKQGGKIYSIDSNGEIIPNTPVYIIIHDTPTGYSVVNERTYSHIAMPSTVYFIRDDVVKI